MLPSREVCVYTAFVTKRAVPALPAAASPLRRLASRLLSVMLVLLGLGSALSGHGQTAIFMGELRQPCSGSCTIQGLPQGVARDAQGNLWVAGEGQAGVTEIVAVNGVLPVPPASSSTVAFNNAIFSSNLAGLAFDAAGDLWVADLGLSTIDEIVAVGGVIPSNPTVKTIISTGLNRPWGLAFDANGNLWFSDRGNNEIKEALAVAGSVPTNPTINIVGSGFNTPEGVWVDAHGNVFVADSENFVIKEVVGVAPPAASTPPATPTINSIGEFSSPVGVAVDSKGNVWVADNASGFFVEVVAVNGSIPASPVIIPVATWPTSPSGQEPGALTIDNGGDIFMAESLESTQGIVSELTPTGNFGQVSVGTTSANAELLFGFLASTTVSAPAVLTQGIPGKDYSSNTSGAGTCTTNGTSHTYSAGNTCIANVLFNPKYPGARWGAAVLSNTGGAVLATGFLQGIGTAPQAVFVDFMGGNESTYPVPNGESFDFGVAVDASGNIYLGATNAGVVEIPSGCSVTSCYITISGSNLEDPKGVAIDGSGNLYVSNGNPASVAELPLGCKASSCAIVLGGGWQNPSDVAVDGAGNIYVADSYNNAIKEMPQGCLNTSCVTALGGGFYVTQAVAVDGYGNVFVADQNLMTENGGTLKEMPAGCHSSSCVTTVASGLPSVSGLAVDAAGDVYTSQEVADASGVYEYEAVNGVIPTAAGVYDLTNPPTSAVGVALDGAGNIYLTNGGLMKLDTVDAPALSFPTPTNVGSQDDDDNPLDDLTQNIGNASLTFTSFAATSNFMIDVPDSGCSTSSPLVAGGICDIDVNFAPTASGPLTGTATLTDNSLNVTGATQPIALRGTGAAVLGPPTASLSLSSLNFGGVQIDTTSPALVETVTNTGSGALSISGVSIVPTGTNGFFLGTGTNQCTNTTSLMNMQSCNVYVTFDPSLNGHTYSGTLDIADNASGSPQTASLTGVGDYFNQNIGNSSSKTAVSVFMATGGTLSAINVVTDGTQTSDYTLQSGGTCATGTAYTAGQVCTVDVIFSPQYSGARNGAIYLTSSSGAVLGTTFLEGTGNAPQIVFGPVAPQTQIGYITGLAGVAVDGADDLFYVNGAYKLIEAPVSGPTVTLANLSSLISGGTTSNVAIDSSGNLFVASNSEAPLVEVPSTGVGTWGAPVSVNTGVGNVSDVATDALGNLYIVAPNSAVYQLPFTGAGYGTPVLLPFPSSSTFKPEGVAVDPNLDVYAIGQKTSGNATEVIELPANNNGYGTAVTTAIAQLTYGSSVATDANGDLYVSGNTSNTNGAIYFVPATGSPVVVGTGLVGNITLDSASNIFAVEANFSDQAEIVEIPQATPPSLTFATTNVGATSSDSPKTVNVTNVGNEALDFYASSSYPTDFPENTSDTHLCNAEFPLNPGAECDVSVNFTPTVSGPLSEDVTLKDENLNNSSSTQLIPVSGTGGGSVAPVAALSPSPATFAGQVADTTSEAMAITLSNTGGAALTGITPTITGTNLGDFAIGTGSNACGTSLAASSTCFIYVTFTPAGTGGFTATLSVADNASPSPQTATLNGTGAAFSSNVGTALAAQQVTVVITTAGTLNSIQVLTQGQSGLDFSEASGGTCATGTAYTVGQTCTVNVIFNPLVPGARLGGVLVTDALNNPLGEAYLPGTGLGPQITFKPGVQTALPGPTYASSYSAPSNIAVDASNNLYVADTLNSAVVRLLWNGTSYGTPVKLPFTLLDQPEAVAVDGVGNVFVADTGNGRILELPWRGPSGFGNQIVLDSSGLGFPDGVAIDGKGNLFFADGELTGKVVEMTWTGSGFAPPATLAAANNLFAPHGLATDSNGDLYITNSANHQVLELPWNGASFGTEIDIADRPNDGLGYPESVAVDAAGDVYIADIQLGHVVEEPWNGTSFGAQITLPITFGLTPNPTGIAVAGNGNIFVSDSGDNTETELNVSTPPSLSFASTNVGSTSSDSPKTVTVTNIGNASLYFNAAANDPVYPVSFPINSSDTNLCQEDNSLYIGGSCDVSVKFVPTTSGPLSGNVVLADNNLNVSGVTQSIAVSGTATGGVSAPTINWTPATPITYGTALGSGDFAATVTSSSTNVSADGTFAYTITSVGGTTATAATVLPGGANTLCVQWTPSSSFTSQYSSASECLPIQVNPASTSIGWTPGTPINQGAALGSAQFNATASAGSTPVTSDGTLTYYVSTVGGTVATSSTVLPSGSNTLCVQWVPSSSYTADYSSSSTCTSVTVNGSTSITWTPASPITYPATLGSGQLNAAAFSGATNVGANGTFTYYVTSVGGTVANSSTVLPGGADTLCVQWVPSSSFTSQYSSASQCLPIQINAGPTSIGWSPSSATIVASSGPTAGQLDAAALNAGETNITADGAVTYHLSTAGGSVVTAGTSLETGPATICAVWAPSSSFTLDYIGSNACQNFTVINTQPTTTTVVTNASPVFLTTSVTFTATVTATSGSLVPTGNVTFFDNGVQIGAGTLAPGTGASATARLTTSSLAAGTHPITVSYAGDTNNQSSTTSAALPEVVEDFTVSASSPTSTTIEPGTSATFTLVVSPLAPATTFPAAITLTATGLPTGATATFAPASIASGAGSTTVTLTVTTPITTLARNQSPPQSAKWPLVALSLLLLPLASKFRRAGRGFSRILSLVLLLAAGLTAAATLSGCGGTPSGYFGQAQTTSTVTVTGTSGSLSHSATVTLTVE